MICNIAERDRGQSHGQFVLNMAECALFVNIKRTRTYSPFNQGGRGNPSKLSENVIKSINLFKLMKPSMFGREIRERLLNDGGNVPALSMETRE